MNFNLIKGLKRLIPNNIKQEGKYLLLRMLKIRYSRSNVSLDILEWLPKKQPITFFDIGASIGDFSKAICVEYEIKKGILIEPVTKLIPILQSIFPDKTKFHIINAAVADEIAETNFYFNEDADFVSSLLRIDNKGDGFASLNFADPVSVNIQALTLDHIFKELQLDVIDLIKIDVQGAEHLVLHGGIETLKKTKLVYTEFSFRPLYERSSTFFDLYSIFYQNDFILVNVSRGYATPDGELLQGDALFVNKTLIKT
ncbi:MAG: FkbM family methyltransferase [Bacteroidota bacterium]